MWGIFDGFAAVKPYEGIRKAPPGALIWPAPKRVQGHGGNQLFTIESGESSFPSVKTVSLDSLSNDLNLVKRACIGIVDTSGDGNSLEHSGGISTGGQNAIILQNKLCIKLTNGENIASLNADNAPTLTQSADPLSGYDLCPTGAKKIQRQSVSIPSLR